MKKKYNNKIKNKIKFVKYKIKYLFLKMKKKIFNN